MDTIEIKNVKKVVPPRDAKPPGSEKKSEPKETVMKEEDISEEKLDPREGNLDEEKAEPKIDRVEDMNLDEKGPEATVKTKVSFTNNDFMKEFVKKNTEESKTKEQAAETEEDTRTTEEIRQQIHKEESDTKNQFTPAEMKDFAEVFIDVIDMLISTGLRFYSKDTSTSAYELPLDKKAKLSRQITNIFIKYQTKFSIEFMFIVTLFICYSVPARKAHTHRKAVKAAESAGAAPPKRTQGKPSK